MFHKGGEEQPLRNNKGRTTRFAKAKKQAKRDTETELQKLTMSTSTFSSMRASWKKDSCLLRRGRGRAWPQELTSLPAAVSTSCGREAVVGWSPEAYRGERKC